MKESRCLYALRKARKIHHGVTWRTSGGRPRITRTHTAKSALVGERRGGRKRSGSVRSGCRRSFSPPPLLFRLLLVFLVLFVPPCSSPSSSSSSHPPALVNCSHASSHAMAADGRVIGDQRPGRWREMARSGFGWPSAPLPSTLVPSWVRCLGGVRRAEPFGCSGTWLARPKVCTSTGSARHARGMRSATCAYFLTW